MLFTNVPLLLPVSTSINLKIVNKIAINLYFSNITFPPHKATSRGPWTTPLIVKNLMIFNDFYLQNLAVKVTIVRRRLVILECTSNF